MDRHTILEYSLYSVLVVHLMALVTLLVEGLILPTFPMLVIKNLNLLQPLQPT
uniref:Uncharacterized protein n=1 Tax=uncultured marine virus TaxID=186617 RepID=A0A0F7L7U7_9VIRU|nr:hypothetical protein [uncultured marine virus]